MTSSLPPSLMKAKNGNYQLSITAIVMETWRRITGLKKAFWGKFFLFFLITFVMGIVLNIGLSSLSLYWKKPMLVKVFRLLSNLFSKVLQWLLAIVLVFLALQHIRKLKINSRSMLEVAREAGALIFIGVLFFFSTLVLSGIGGVVLTRLNLALNCVNLSHGPLNLHFILSSLILLSLDFILIAPLYIYVAMVMVMVTLLILDKKMGIKASLSLAFRAIKQHVIKNISLGLVEALVFVVANLIIGMLLGGYI